jgi:hypothetical protein
LRRVVIALAVLLAGGAAALGLLLLAMVGGFGCASEDVARDPDGAWRIARTNCGATVGFVWHVHVRGTDGQERVAFETTPYPDAARAEIAAGGLHVWSSDAGVPWVVPLDDQRRPAAPLRLREGHPRR